MLDCNSSWVCLVTYSDHDDDSLCQVVVINELSYEYNYSTTTVLADYYNYNTSQLELNCVN